MTRGELAAALVLMLALGWTGWDVSRIGNATDTLPPIARTAVLAAPPADLPEDAFADIVRRSLFTPLRRADFTSASDRPDAVGGHVLRGVLFGATADVALFEPLSGGAALRLHVGSMIGGYRIVAVEEDGVVLERDDRRRRLPINESAPPLVLGHAKTDFQQPGSNPDFSQAPHRAPTADEIEQ